MGLIILPCLIFWLIIVIYSLFIGYDLLGTFARLSYSLTIGITAVLSIAIYVYITLSRFKGKKELGAFDIMFCFLANIKSFLFVVFAIVMYWFGSTLMAHQYLESLSFIIIFTLSVGALVGAFSAEAFMNKHGINKTY